MNFEGSHHSHGAPLGEDLIKRAKAKLGFDENANFIIDEDVENSLFKCGKLGDLSEARWNKTLENSGKKSFSISF